MKIFKVLFFQAITVGIVLLLFSCNNNVTKTPEATTQAPPAATAMPEPTTFVTFKITVADYDKWHANYVSDAANQQAAGMKSYAILRDVTNPNILRVLLSISDVQKAKSFAADPRLKEVMQKGGVIGAPEISYLNFIHNDQTKIENKSRLIIKHRVKDFDAWLKVYDAEGKATKAEQGLVDRVLARDIDDPNMVTIVFAVTDMAKAKTIGTSEAKKNLMISAGVIGAPSIEFLTRVE